MRSEIQAGLHLEASTIGERMVGFFTWVKMSWEASPVWNCHSLLDVIAFKDSVAILQPCNIHIWSYRFIAICIWFTYYTVIVIVISTGSQPAATTVFVEFWCSENLPTLAVESAAAGTIGKSWNLRSNVEHSWNGTGTLNLFRMIGAPTKTSTFLGDTDTHTVYC